MRRDPWPILLATATAVVSCGVLVLAVAQGWLGPDVGRGSAFCEAPRDGAVRQPANTFSNLGFVAAGLLIAGHASLRATTGARLFARRHLAAAMACLVVLLGPASAAMHATQSALGGHLDLLSMYLIAAFAAAYAVTRWRHGSPGLFAGMFVGGIAFCELLGLWSAELPVVQHAGNLAFGLLIATAGGLELLMIRRDEVRSRRIYAYGALATLLAAFAIWNAANAWLCDPGSLIQGHAVWHILCAMAAYLLYRYYASEEVTVRGPASDRRVYQTPV